MTEEQEEEIYESYNRKLNEARTVDADSEYDDEEHDPHEFDGCVPNQ